MSYVRKNVIPIVLFMLMASFISCTSIAAPLSFPEGEAIGACDGSSECLKSLSESGVFVQSSAKTHNEIYELYAEYKQKSQPVFITTDILFHTAHKVFDYSLITSELELLPLLKTFSKEMLQGALKLKTEWGKNEALISPINQLIGYFAVPNILLGNEVKSEDSLKEKAEGEIALIQSRKGFDFSNVLNQKEDYSQYAVRGHYSRSEDLKKFFLVSMWYGRRMFRFDESDPEGAGSPPDRPDIKGGWYNDAQKKLHEIARDEITAGCLMVYMIENTKVDGKSAFEVYKQLKLPFDFLVGRSEDISIETLSGVIKKAFGENWKPADLTDETKLFTMAKQLADSNTVKIDASGMGRKGLTLLGQRFILDAALFQSLVHSKENPLRYIGKASKGEKPFTWVMDNSGGEVRGFPRGMDVMAVLGSEKAAEILKQKGDADYENYDKEFESLKKEYQSFKPDKPEDNIYEKMLYAFMPLFQVGKNAPQFMQSDLWKKKSMNTALGAWTELRHDTVLYGKQSYTSVSRGGIGYPLKQAYLEPNPEVYRRLSSLFSDMKKSEIIKNSEILSKYQSLTEIFDKLVKISENELKGNLPDETETDFLIGLSERLKNEAKAPSKIAEIISGEADSQMPLVTDVHTRIPEALTEAVGFPMEIIVAIPVKEKPVLFFGGVYSCYEFKVPYEKRLTDEQWAEELKSGKTKYKRLFF